MESKRHRFLKFLTAVITLLALLMSYVLSPASSAGQDVFAAASTWFDDSSLGSWVSQVPQNGQFDVSFDQQTSNGQEVSQDIVGNASLPAFQTKYDSTNSKIGFKFRLNSRDGQNDSNPAYKNFAFVGIEVANSNGTFDGSLDLFIGIYNVNTIENKNKGRIGIYKVDPSKLNNSPSTTGIINPPLVQYATSTTTNFQLVKDTSKINNDPDFMLSFYVPISDINFALQSAGKQARINSSTALRYIIGTSSQDNSFNQDIAGLNGLNTKSSTTWSELGAYTQTTNLSGSNKTTVTFVDDNATSQKTIATLSVVSGYPLGCALPTVANTATKYFLGWGTDSNPATRTVDFSSSSIVSGPKTVYAVWSDRYNAILFDANYTGGTSTTVNIASGAAIGLNLPAPTRTDYFFMGWNTQADGNGRFISPSEVPPDAPPPDHLLCPMESNLYS